MTDLDRQAAHDRLHAVGAELEAASEHLLPVTQHLLMAGAVLDAGMVISTAARIEGLQDALDAFAAMLLESGPTDPARTLDGLDLFAGPDALHAVGPMRYLINGHEVSEPAAVEAQARGLARPVMGMRAAGKVGELGSDEGPWIALEWCGGE